MPAKPLRLEVTAPADRQMRAIENWLKSLPNDGLEAAARFGETIARVLPDLCQDITERLASGSNLPRPDEEASIAFSQPAYKRIFTTLKSGRRTKRQQSSTYLLFYAVLTDTNTLYVLGLRHAAAEPLTAFLDPTNDNLADDANLAND